MQVSVGLGLHCIESAFVARFSTAKPYIHRDKIQRNKKEAQLTNMEKNNYIQSKSDDDIAKQCECLSYFHQMFPVVL